MPWTQFQVRLFGLLSADTRLRRRLVAELQPDDPSDDTDLEGGDT